jgi:mono/diheme cytochrome c family protein
MTQWPIRFFSGALVLACSTFANAQTRGELLYTTHCVSCHTAQVHWRAKKQATDWDSLTLQVRRWQGNAGLQWPEADVNEVSRYLNEAFYRFPPPAERTGQVAPPKS